MLDVPHLLFLIGICILHLVELVFQYVVLGLIFCRFLNFFLIFEIFEALQKNHLAT